MSRRDRYSEDERAEFPPEPPRERCTCHARSLEPCAACSEPADEPEHVASILPRALRAIRGPSRTPPTLAEVQAALRYDEAARSTPPIYEVECVRCATHWLESSLEAARLAPLCPSCVAAERP